MAFVSFSPIRISPSWPLDADLDENTRQILITPENDAGRLVVSCLSL